MQDLSSQSELDDPVTPIILASKFFKYFLILAGQSLSGSSETKTNFKFKQCDSGIAQMYLNTRANLNKVAGHISGHLVKPKQIMQQAPYKSLLENLFPLKSIKFQSPPMCVFLFSTTVQSPVIFYSISSLSCFLISYYTQAIIPVRNKTPPPNMYFPDPPLDLQVQGSSSGFAFSSYSYVFLNIQSLVSFLPISGLLSTEKQNFAFLFKFQAKLIVWLTLQITYGHLYYLLGKVPWVYMFLILPDTFVKD